MELINKTIGECALEKEKISLDTKSTNNKKRIIELLEYKVLS